MTRVIPSKEAREAAADYMFECREANYSTMQRVAVREGKRDDTALVQAFHRFQLEEQERCAEIADEQGGLAAAYAIRKQFYRTRRSYK